MTTPDDKSAQILAYLREAKRFGKRAGDYETAWKVVEKLSGLSQADVETFTTAIDARLFLEYATLSNDYYNKVQNNEAVVCADVREKG
jgi:hypothetical protein